MKKVLTRFLAALQVGLLLVAAGKICQAQVTGLYSFTGGSDGASISAGLLQASDHNLYGVATYGGAYNSGTIYKIDLQGNFTLLHTFTGGADGANPYTDLLQASDGNLYGVARYGGAYNNGTIYKIDLQGNFTSVYSFTGGNDGAQPYGGLLQASDGNLYGSTHLGGANNCGTIFKIDLQGNFTLLYTFTGGNDGASPYDSLMQASDGNLYGNCITGGAFGWGTLFKIDLVGNFTLVYAFTGTADGASPYSRLLQASDGNLYGTAHGGGVYGPGGANNYGTIYKIDLQGNFTTVYSFMDSSDGDYPVGGLIEATDGNLYGTTDGAPGNGTIFRYNLTPTYTISNINVAPIGFTTATITWNTNLPANSVVEYGTTDAYGHTASSATRTTSHSLSLKGLLPLNLYHFRVKSTTATGLTTLSNDATFVTDTLPVFYVTYANLRTDASGNYLIDLTFHNQGGITVPSVHLFFAALGAAMPTSPTLPFVLTSPIANGASHTVTLTFPSAAGSSGAGALLSGGGWTDTTFGDPAFLFYNFYDRVTLP